MEKIQLLMPVFYKILRNKKDISVLQIYGEMYNTAMFRDFINACKDSDRYSQMRLRVYAKLSLDKGRGGDFTDGEFLEVTKEIFATFDLVQEAKLEFTLNTEKFNVSPAKRKIESIIAEIVNVEKEYEEELSKWEMEQQFGGPEEEPKYSDEDEEQEEAIEKYYNNIIDDIQKELNNPKKFYLKREKMFIFESEKLMRKISKLFSMAPDTKVNKLHTKISNKEIKTESILNWEKYQYAIGVNTEISTTFSSNRYLKNK